MAVDFRASQFRGAKFISSGSTGTGAKLLIYDIAADTGGSNTGTIDPAKFNTGSIGTDVFMYVSGTVSSGSSSDRVSVFGGSLIVSGTLTIGSSSIRINSNSILFSSSSISSPNSALIQVADTANGSALASPDLVVAGTRKEIFVDNDLVIKAGTVFSSGSGGSVIVQGGDGGFRDTDNDKNDGGDILLYTGHGGVTSISGQDFQAVGSGGDLFIGLGSGSQSPDARDGGSGGLFNFLGGTGGSVADAAIETDVRGGNGGSFTVVGGEGGATTSSNASTTSGIGGSISMVAGLGGVNGRKGTAGDGGEALLSSGDGGVPTFNTARPGNAGALYLLGGAGGDGSYSAGGNGGDIIIEAGAAGQLSSSAPNDFGNFTGAVLIIAGEGGTNNANAKGYQGGDIRFIPGVGGLGHYTAGLGDWESQAKGGDFSIIGTAVDTYGSQSLSGSNFQTENINRIFFNASTTIGWSTFPGEDIGFFVSGTRGGIVSGGVRYNRVSVFGGDLYVSGNLTVGVITSSAGISIGAGAASDFSTDVGALTLNGKTGVNLQLNSATKFAINSAGAVNSTPTEGQNDSVNLTGAGQLYARSNMVGAGSGGGILFETTQTDGAGSLAGPIYFTTTQNAAGTGGNIEVYTDRTGGASTVGGDVVIGAAGNTSPGRVDIFTKSRSPAGLTGDIQFNAGLLASVTRFHSEDVPVLTIHDGIAAGKITVQAAATLTTTGNGNINLPNNGSSRFKIETVAVSANVTSVNLGTLTAGIASNADSLHTHTLSASLPAKFIPVGFYVSTTLTSSNPQVVGQAVLSQSEVPAVSILFRSVLSTTGVATASVKLWNISSGSFVEIGGTGVTTLTTVSTTPRQVQSVNLLSAVNFGTGSNIYEVQVFTQTGSISAVHGSSMFVCT